MRSKKIFFFGNISSWTVQEFVILSPIWRNTTVIRIVDVQKLWNFFKINMMMQYNNWHRFFCESSSLKNILFPFYSHIDHINISRCGSFKFLIRIKILQQKLSDGNSNPFKIWIIGALMLQKNWIWFSILFTNFTNEKPLWKFPEIRFLEIKEF